MRPGTSCASASPAPCSLRLTWSGWRWSTAIAAGARPRGHADGSSQRAARGARPTAAWRMRAPAPGAGPWRERRSGWRASRMRGGGQQTRAAQRGGRGVGGGGRGVVAAGKDVVAAAPRATAPSTSALVTRPSLPVPGTAAADSWWSASSLAAAGMATPAFAAWTAAGATVAAAAETAEAADAAARPSVSMRAMTCSEATVAPSPRTISASRPAAGAGTSSTTLSVSISIRISSIATAWPGFFFHPTKLPSTTHSNSAGTSGTMGMRVFACRAQWRSFGQHEALDLAERAIDQRLLLLLVQVRVTDGRRCRCRAAGVAQFLAFVHVLVDVVLHEEPGALVLRLVLAPDHIDGLGVALELCGKGFVRERVQLLDAQDRHIIDGLLAAPFDQVVVHLAGAGQHAPDLGVLFDDGFVLLGNHRQEAAPGELGQRRGGVLVAQQRLGRHDDQRLAQRAHHLAPQHMENLAGRGRLHHLHVGVGRHLHEALQTRRTVLGALAFVAMGQHQRDAVDAAPLDFARGDELVDHHLRAIGEVAELGFPDHQGIGVVKGVP